MSVEIRPVNLNKREIKRFVEFGNSLYKGNDFYVPPLLFDEVDTFIPSRNPAFDFCDAALFMAWRDGKPVGRIAALVNRKVNESSGRREARFGWIEFIDDEEVFDALMDAAEGWARSRGMDQMIGPMGLPTWTTRVCSYTVLTRRALPPLSTIIPTIPAIWSGEDMQRMLTGWSIA